MYKRIARMFVVVAILSTACLIVFTGNAVADSVVTAAGVPIEGALVKLVAYPQYNDTTDVNGVYSIINVPEGIYLISAMKSDVGANISTVQIMANTNLVYNIILNAEPSLATYTFPFVSGGLEDIDLVIPSSDAHGFYNARAHTQDTTGAVVVANSLLTYPLAGNNFSSVLDTDISTYSGGIVTLSPNLRNVITVGGFYVNNLEYKYNSQLSVQFKNHPSNGTLGVYVPSSDNYYFSQSGAYGVDYGFISLHQDSRWLLFVAGLNKEGTKAASDVLGNYLDYSIDGDGAVVKYADTDGDGILDIISIEEMVTSSDPVNLSVYPNPFVAGGLGDVDVVIPSSDLHGFYNAGAHTQDTTGAVVVANSLLTYPLAGNNFSSVLDTDISTYSGGIVTLSSDLRNVITMGGFYVNNLEYKYNSQLSAQFKNHPSNGTLGVYVPSSDNYYFTQNGAFGEDYGFISLHNDNSRWLLFVAGLNKESTKAASDVLGNYQDYPLQGSAVVVKYADTDGDSILDIISIVEAIT